MPQKECEDLVLQAVTQVFLLFVVHFTRCHINHTDFRALTSCWQAIRRDGSSGGCCRMAIITKVKINRCKSCEWKNTLIGRGGEEAVAEQRAAHQVLGGDQAHPGLGGGDPSIKLPNAWYTFRINWNVFYVTNTCDLFTRQREHRFSSLFSEFLFWALNPGWGDVELLWWARLHPFGWWNCSWWAPSVCKVRETNLKRDKNQKRVYWREKRKEIMKITR